MKLTIVTNIPSPYRLHLFGALDAAMQSRNGMLEVMFMAEGERGRFWKVDSSNWSFRGKLVLGIHPAMGGVTYHLNPGIWIETLRHPPTWLVVGGGWHLPTSIGLQFLHHDRTYRLMWAEANHKSSRYRTGPVSRYRQWAMRSADAVVIQGRIARDTVVDHWRLPMARLLYLPQLVDETIFRDTIGQLRRMRQELRTKYNLDEDRITLFWSARLLDATKGITNFLNAARGLPITVLLAGDGRDRPLIEKWASEHDDFDLQLLGHLPQETMIEYMALSDAAILPSFSDPNPLSMVEAIWARLPIITSVNCGNWPETVEPGHNGWLVDPSNPDTIRVALNELLSLSHSKLKEMGNRSLEIAERNFNTVRKVDEFVDSLILQLPPRI